MKPGARTRRLLQIPVLLLITIIIIPGCDPIRDFIDDLKKEDPSASKIIGTAGGELNYEGIKIVVPENTFSEDNELTISVSDGADEFGENAASSLYQLDGFPPSTSKAIRITIAYKGSLTGDPLVALGELRYAVSLDSTLYTYHTVEAVDSSGFLVFELQPYSKPVKADRLKSGSTSEHINIMALTGMTTKTSTNKHFSIRCPIQHAQKAVLMGEYFENSYNTCYKMGFRYRVGTEEYKWPLKVTVRGLGPETAGQYSCLTSKDMTDRDLLDWVKDGTIEINTSTLSKDLELRATCGHEFLHFVQNIYEFSAPDIEPEQAWLQEAMAVWIEEKYANTPNYYSSSFKNREYHFLNGIQYSGIGYSKHGYGLPFIIKDIAEKYGEDAILKIHKKIKEGTLPGQAVDPLDAVFSVITEPVEDFFYRVCSSYFLGHYYNKQASKKLLDQVKNIYSGMMFDANNRTMEFKHTYHDLSAQLYWVTGSDFGSMNKVPLSFTVDDADSCGILVCKHKAGSDLTLLGEVKPGRDGMIIFSDLLPVFNDGYELVVLVVNTRHNKTNSYQSKNEVILTMEMVSGLTSGSVEFFLDDVEFIRDDQTQPYSADLTEVLHLHHLSGSLNNNIYVGSYYYKSLGRTYSGDLTIKFLQDPERLNLHLDHRMSFKGNFGFGERKYHYVVDYNDLPYEKFDAVSGTWIYSQSGSSVSKMRIDWDEENNLYKQTLKDHNCGSSAYIRVAVDAK